MDVGTFSDKITGEMYMRTFPYITITIKGDIHRIIIGKNKDNEGILVSPKKGR